MNEGLYTSAEQDLVSDWAEKWIQLIGLINVVTGTDGPPWSPPPPSDFDELRYQALRFWFIDHEIQFVPLWKSFYETREWALSQKDEGFDEADLRNPFSFFYEPENFYHLAQQLGLQNGIDLWEPSEYRASMVRPLMIRLGEIMIEFIDWVETPAT